MKERHFECKRRYLRASRDPYAQSGHFTGPSGPALSASGHETVGGPGGQMTPFADARVLGLRVEEMLSPLPCVGTS
jgi:hypothetical protein